MPGYNIFEKCLLFRSRINRFALVLTNLSPPIPGGRAAVPLAVGCSGRSVESGPRTEGELQGMDPDASGSCLCGAGYEILRWSEMARMESCRHRL